MPRGIPHSKFLGWDPSDQDKALAWLVADRARCSVCGTIPEEWLSAREHDDDGNPMPVIPPPFEAEPRVCGGCEERDRFEKNVFGDRERPHGTHVVLVPADPNDYIDDMKNGPSLLDADLVKAE